MGAFNFGYQGWGLLVIPPPLQLSKQFLLPQSV
nr:MAG TPA: hypothetical protein [Crassvirales sp.]